MNEILLPESSSSKGKGKKRKAVDERLKDFRVEYAKSGRSTCAGCGNMIPKGEVRVIHIVYDTDVGARFGQQPISHHPSCFNEIRGDYNYYLGGADLMGFSELAKEDREMIKNAIKPIEIDEKMAKKLKSEPVDKKEAVEMSQLEKLIEKQAKVLFKIRDTIKGITKKGDLQNILFVNDSGMVSGQDGLLDRVADFLTFGAIEKCPKCGKGDLIFGKGGYYCNGQIDEWTLCENFIEKPKRRKCKIPRELKETQNFFTKYQPRVEDRAVRPRPVEIKKQVKEEIGTEKTFKVQREKEPLDGLHLYVVGNLEGDKTILKTRIEKLGGRLVKTLQEKIAAVISTEAEVKKMSKKMQEVKELNIQVVPENFIDVVKKLKRSEAIEKITEMAICDWGSDPLSRIPSEQEMAPKVREDIYERRGANKPKQLVVKLKNGSALDPETGLEDIAHVYRDKTTNLLYTTVLNYVDIQKNKNSYYKLQVLEADNEKKYWLFRSWGRVGTGVGEKKLETYYSVNEACEQFERLFEEKSGNIFGTPFKKMPNKYALVEVDYTDDEKVKAIQEKSAIPSKLPSPVQDIIKMIFDVDAMKQTMLEFELDLEKMPLGKISRKQLEEAYSVLNKLDNLITEGADRSAFIGASNKFFSLVPHSFGMRAAPVIDSVEAIKSKREMIDSLLEIEIAYSMLKDDTKENVNPIDSHYEKLKTEIHPLDKKSKEYEIIQRYVENTHAPTHDQYKLEIDQVFKVSRQGEKRRYKPFQKLHNRQLLWHGSRVTNYAGILSHGLKIAPPEAPVTGYMFGKGKIELYLLKKIYICNDLLN